MKNNKDGINMDSLTPTPKPNDILESERNP